MVYREHKIIMCDLQHEPNVIHCYFSLKYTYQQLLIEMEKNMIVVIVNTGICTQETFRVFLTRNLIQSGDECHTYIDYKAKQQPTSTMDTFNFVWQCFGT